MYYGPYGRMPLELRHIIIRCLDVWTCSWPFQLHSTQRNRRDLNVSCLEVRTFSTKTCWHSSAINFVPNCKCGQMHRPAGKHTTFQTTPFVSMARLHLSDSQSFIFVTFSILLKKCGGLISTSLDTTPRNSIFGSNFVRATMGTSSWSWASLRSFLWLILVSTVEISSSGLFLKEHESSWWRSTRFVLAVSESICLTWIV